MRTATQMLRSGALCLCLLLFLACTPKVAIKPVVTEIPGPVQKQFPDPARLVDTPTPRAGEPACWWDDPLGLQPSERVLCTDQIQRLTDATDRALLSCNNDKAAIRNWASRP